MASNKLAGVVNVRPVRLYSGAEDDGPHGLAMAGDGSMVRVVTGAADSRKLYRQRIAAPGPLSDFSAWTYMAVWVSSLYCLRTGRRSQSRYGPETPTLLPGWQLRSSSQLRPCS